MYIFEGYSELLNLFSLASIYMPFIPLETKENLWNHSLIMPSLLGSAIALIDIEENRNKQNSENSFTYNDLEKSIQIKYTFFESNAAISRLSPAGRPGKVISIVNSKEPNAKVVGVDLFHYLRMALQKLNTLKAI